MIMGSLYLFLIKKIHHVRRNVFAHLYIFCFFENDEQTEKKLHIN